jgi:hypothetical protein
METEKRTLVNELLISAALQCQCSAAVAKSLLTYEREVPDSQKWIEYTMESSLWIRTASVARGDSPPWALGGQGLGHRDALAPRGIHAAWMIAVDHPTPYSHIPTGRGPWRRAPWRRVRAVRAVARR